MDTDALITNLSKDARPVRPLPSPAVRATVWLGVGLAVVVAMMAIHGIDAEEIHRAVNDPRLIAEEAATLVTAVSAALAAFASTTPGVSRRWFPVPFIALAVWVLLTGGACLADYARIGPPAFDVRLDTDCFLPGAIAGAILSVIIIAMIRRGAPMVPRLTFVFAGIAVAATVNFGLLVLHEGDVSIMLLTWHTAYMALFAAVGGAIAPSLFGWRHAKSVG